MDKTIMAVIFLWLIAVTSAVIWIIYYFKKFSKDVDKGNLIKLLDKIIAKEELNSKEIHELSKTVDTLGEDAIRHIQKVGMVRFNPFEELGGDHSFSLALLDATLSGYVITGLHTRERTRVYVKNIEKGKSTSELSNQEKEAIRKAQKGIE